jgi:hypothetical protein
MAMSLFKPMGGGEDHQVMNLFRNMIGVRPRGDSLIFDHQWELEKLSRLVISFSDWLAATWDSNQWEVEKITR